MSVKTKRRRSTIYCSFGAISSVQLSFTHWCERKEIFLVLHKTFSSLQENAGERASIGGAPWEGELCARLLSSLHHPCRGYARRWQPLLVKIRIGQRLDVKAKTSGMRSFADLVLPPISTTEAFSALSSIYLASRRPLLNGSQELRWDRLKMID